MKQTEIAPAFQCYAADTLAELAELSHEEAGIYWRLALFAWRDVGLPTDTVRLARLVSLSPRKFALVWRTLSRHFEERGDRYVLAWQEAQRLKMATNRTKKKDAAALRWGEIPGAYAYAHAPPNASSDGHADEDAHAMQVDNHLVCSSVAVASAVAGTTDTDSLTTARHALRERMPGEYRGDLDRLLERMRSDGARLSWVYNLAQLLQDETPNGPQVPTEVAVLGAAIRQFNGAEETSWIRYCGYVRRVTSEPAQNSAAGGTIQPNGHRPTLPRGGRVTASDRISAIIAGSTNGTNGSTGPNQ